MAGIEYFKTFYGGLSATGLILFWSVIFFVFLLIFFAIMVTLKNKELSRALIKEIEAKKATNIKKEEVVEKVTEENVEGKTKTEEEIIEKEVSLEEEVFEEKNAEKEEIIPNGPYQKNILKEMETRYQTSPIHIIKKENDTVNLSELNNINNSYTQKLNPINITKTDYDEEYYNSINDGKTNVSFVEEISKKLEKMSNPNPIELTEYEQKQEEEAIISYQQLLQTRDNDKTYSITDDEEIDDFIDALKEFRINL